MATFTPNRLPPAPGQSASRGFRSEVHRKKPVGKGATAKTIKRTERSNSRKSKVHAHIEHVFAVQQQKMGMFVRTIGIDRAKLKTQPVRIAFGR